MSDERETMRVPLILEMEEIEMLESAKASLHKLRPGNPPISFEDVIRVLVELGDDVLSSGDFTAAELATKSPYFLELLEDNKKFGSGGSARRADG